MGSEHASVAHKQRDRFTVWWQCASVALIFPTRDIRRLDKKACVLNGKAQNGLLLQLFSLQVFSQLVDYPHASAFIHRAAFRLMG